MLIIGISLLLGIQQPFDQLLEDTKGSHIMLYGDSQLDDMQGSYSSS